MAYNRGDAREVTGQTVLVPDSKQKFSLTFNTLIPLACVHYVSSWYELMVVTCFLMTTSHYLKQYLLIISEGLWCWLRHYPLSIFSCKWGHHTVNRLTDKTCTDETSRIKGDLGHLTIDLSFQLKKYMDIFICLTSSCITLSTFRHYVAKYKWVLLHTTELPNINLDHICCHICHS